ncbi:MAG: 30S ribosomal protein S4 [Chloroflexi bacterium]|nr:MAG: 30S ribosomal protein S4 [Chloroflexota bacterium]TME77477.1 MAG: 30S ribosomal protein S4 [Chloroflexota bacterium]TME86927.1 MAG: 30S ribosomal protein S4 [Chloroflexota bacterium]TMF54838.1 MAG: 30S ribosomal protein S4 [Chloroflexota bacterium]
MARYTGPVCRLCRREGMKLFLKGEKCLTKCTFERRSSPPGMHQQRRRKVSDFALQLREKQKARRIYGVLERQMKNTFEQAAEIKGATGEVMLQNLERRLDNTVYRSGFGKSRSQARQLVAHAHIKVNGKITKTPSYQVKAGDLITVRESSRDSNYFKEMLAWAKTQTRPGWLETDPENFSAKVLSVPTRDQIEAQVNTQLIVEHYSR